MNVVIYLLCEKAVSSAQWCLFCSYPVVFSRDFHADEIIFFHQYQLLLIAG